TLALTACADRGDEPSTSTDVAAVLDPYTGHQGRLLLGFGDLDVRTFTLPGLVSPHVVAHGQLIANGLNGQALAGAKVTATDGVPPSQMGTVSVTPPPSSTPPNDAWLYALEQWDTATAHWVPACAEPLLLIPPTPPPPSPPLAYAIPGTWTRDGLYTYDSTKVSFARKTGVVAKCIGWGYWPTNHWPTVTENGLTTPPTRPPLLH